VGVGCGCHGTAAYKYLVSKMTGTKRALYCELPDLQRQHRWRNDAGSDHRAGVSWGRPL
jgi:hypothetical protein